MVSNSIDKALNPDPKRKPEKTIKFASDIDKIKFDVEADIVDYMETNGKRIQELSLRMAIKLAELIKMRPTDWQSVANVTCIKRGA